MYIYVYVYVYICICIIRYICICIIRLGVKSFSCLRLYICYDTLGISQWIDFRDLCEILGK